MTNGLSPLSGDEEEVWSPPSGEDDAGNDYDLPPVVNGYPDLLPPNKTRLERALASSTGRIDNEINAAIIDTLLQAYKIPAAYLPWLAWHMSLSLWDWNWDEEKQRAVTARAVELNRMKGTAQALRVYSEIMDSEVVEIMVPPQEFWIGNPLTKAQWDAWIHTMPEIRIKLIHGNGTASIDEWYHNAAPQWTGPAAPAGNTWQIWTLDLGQLTWTVDTDEFASQAAADAHIAGLSPSDNVFVTRSPTMVAPPNDEIPITHGNPGLGIIGQSFMTDDQGMVLYGRRIIQRIGGVDYPLQHVERTTTEWENKTIDVERFSTIGKSTMGFFLDNDYIEEDDKSFLDAAETEPKMVTLRLDGTYVHEASELGLTAVWPDLKPVSPRYERNSDIGDAGPFLFLDDFFMGADDRYVIASGATTFDYTPAIIEHNRAGDLLADRIFLIDPSVAVPMMEGMSFIGVSRLGMPAYRAEVIVDLHMKQPNDFLFIGEGFVDQSLLGELDEEPLERSFYALTAAKAIRDKVMVRFDPLRQITATDLLTPNLKIGDWVPDRL